MAAISRKRTLAFPNFPIASNVECMKHLLLILSLGLCVACSPNGNASSSELIPTLEKLAAEENAEAMYHLGMAYHTGSGVDRDYKKSLTYFQDSARLGDPLGAYKLRCYYDGQGNGAVERNLDEALKYKLIAAEAGYALAQQDVAGIYANRGESDNAMIWLEKAVGQGWSGALMTYASVHNGSPGIQSDPVKTAAYFRLFLDRAKGDKGQEDWLRTFEENLTTEQMSQARKIVSEYQAKPTPLTLKALAGQTSAEQLVNVSN
ncbi:tetratricopeptide repeat protein [Parasphingorhabdus sp.]|uniref:tetratricopeptide repeat protein n=1 Tax=Parasphingorhabdus sp. TaxID=2709688 RepID=UPI003D2A78EE